MCKPHISIHMCKPLISIHACKPLISIHVCKELTPHQHTRVQTPHQHTRVQRAIARPIPIQAHVALLGIRMSDQSMRGPSQHTHDPSEHARRPSEPACPIRASLPGHRARDPFEQKHALPDPSTPDPPERECWGLETALAAIPAAILAISNSITSYSKHARSKHG